MDPLLTKNRAVATVAHSHRFIRSSSRWSRPGCDDAKNNHNDMVASIDAQKAFSNMNSFLVAILLLLGPVVGNVFSNIVYNL